MAVYIEYIIIDNIVMDYIILRLMELSIGIKFNKLGKVLVCMLGSMFALVMPMFFQYKILMFLYRIITSVILVLCIKKYKKLKNFVVYYLMFFAYTFFVGGVCLGVINMLGIDYTMSSVVMYEFNFPFGVFGIILILVLKIMTKVIFVVKSKLKSSNYIKSITLMSGENFVEVFAFVDTGNKIKFNGQVVNIISYKAFSKLYKNIKIEDVVIGRLDNNEIKGLEYIDICGIGEARKYLSFLVDNVAVGGTNYKGTRFALTWNDLGDYDVILNSEFMGGGYEKFNSQN